MKFGSTESVLLTNIKPVTFCMSGTIVKLHCICLITKSNEPENGKIKAKFSKRLIQCSILSSILKASFY